MSFRRVFARPLSSVVLPRERSPARPLFNCALAHSPVLDAWHRASVTSQTGRFGWCFRLKARLLSEKWNNKVNTTENIDNKCVVCVSSTQDKTLLAVLFVLIPPFPYSRSPPPISQSLLGGASAVMSASTETDRLVTSRKRPRRFCHVTVAVSIVDVVIASLSLYSMLSPRFISSNGVESVSRFLCWRVGDSLQWLICSNFCVGIIWKK